MLLLGIGNRLRGDDGVGPEVVDRVAELHLDGLVVATETEPMALLHWLMQPAPPDRVVLVDATAPLGDPGRLHVLRDPGARWTLPSPPVGSHAVGLAEVLELARTLDLLPPRLTVVGVEAGCVELGAGLSAPVRDSLDDAVAVLVDLAADLAAGSG